MVFEPEQLEAPLLEALLACSSRCGMGFHMPGHGRGRGLPREFGSLSGTDLFAMDVTELPGLDDLHRPTGVIARAMGLASRAWGAGHSFFLVNGTTCGLQALILATCTEQDTVIMPRDVHRAVMGGLVLTGSRPCYVEPEVVKGFGLTAGAEPGKIVAAMEMELQSRAVLVTHPNYYGITTDLKTLAGEVQARGSLLFADEAHGAHLHFHPGLPGDALALGADAAVQSVHKTAGALTQSSILHLRGGGINPGRVAAALRLLETSSPSYILMASLDAARRQLACQGEEILSRILSKSAEMRRGLREVPGLQVLEQEHLPAGNFELDRTRLVVSVTGLGLTGFQVAEFLRKRYDIQPEMADYHNVVFLLGPGLADEHGPALVEAMRDLAVKERSAPLSGQPFLVPPAPPLRKTPRQAWLSRSRRVALDEAAGLVSAEMIAVYPPGIPAVCPGEELTPEIVEYLLAVRKLKLIVQGPLDLSLTWIEVVEE